MIPTTTTARTAPAFIFQGREQQQAPQRYCGAKRERSSTFAEDTDSLFKPKLTRGRLSSFLGESLPSNNGLSKTPLLQSAGEFSTTPFAPFLSGLKSRGRTASLASENTLASSNLQKCSKCGQHSASVAGGLGSPLLSSPGKY